LILAYEENIIKGENRSYMSNEYFDED